ncbi:PREDICTED: tyrosine-protein phosphatase 10D isoform X2 [Dinoponera quadriceps]|uniref:protein-tyrosine-phosphatase n=1 Tax=Dinoponera quadriceps TaxID=609295 RepID=A0A6P3XZV1_DINQU|nr:PREDICTED: tyrosine-protein phosphatase 10D isoform X2 [Dinoponera quadriceps]
MILEKHLLLLVHVLCFLCARCDDDTFTSSETAIVEFTESNYDKGPTESFTCCDSTSMPSLTSQDPRSTDSLEDSTISEHSTMITRESTIEAGYSANLPTDPSEEATSISSTVGSTTQTTRTTVIDDTTTTSTMSPICDSSWPVNATEDTREVINLKEEEIGAEWVTLSWEFLCATSVSVTYFIERCDDEKNCKRIDQNDTWYNATGLDACMLYTFTVRISTGHWESKGTDLRITTKDTISEIGDVRFLNVSAVDLNSVQLTWLAPEKHTRCISNYSITQCIGQSCNETAVPVTNYIADNLEQCTQYNFTVKTVTLIVESAGANASAKTVSPILLKPQSITIIPSNFSLTVQWQPPQSGSTCLKHYRVIVTPENSSKIIVGTNTTIENLYACVLYSVFVNAVNEDDQDGHVISGKGETTPTKTGPPTLQIGDLTTTNSILVFVNITKTNNHCPVKSLVTVCNYTSSNGTGFELHSGVSFDHLDTRNPEESFISLNTTVSELSPFTEYACRSRTLNDGGSSEDSNAVTTQTLEDVPGPPKFLVTNITESQFSLAWNRPEHLPGIVEDYDIRLLWTPLFPVPTWCNPEISNTDEIMELNDTRSYDYLKAKAYRQYEVKMKARTGAGWGNYSESWMFSSKSTVSDEVTNVVCNIEPHLNDTNKLDTIVKWKMPCSLNGKLEVYNVSVHGIRDGYKNHTFSISEECADYIDNNYTCSVNLQELKGEYNYTFSVSPKILYVDAPGPVTSRHVLYPAGIPSQPDTQYVRSITINPLKAIKSTTTATILLPLFPDTNGNIKYYAIMVSELGYNEPMSARLDLKNNSWPNASSWREAMLNDFSITYQATTPLWNPYPDHVIDYGHKFKAVKFTIGTDNFCSDISSNSEKHPLYCNGPLKPDTWYHVRIRAFTEGGYADSALFVAKTDAELNVAIVIGVVFGILFLGILTTMMLLVRKCSPYVVLRRFLHSDMPGSPVPAPFTRKKFIAHCQQLVDNPGKLSNEFRLLQTLSVDLQMPTNTACLQANRKKNRYSDILPYDFSRVKLDVIDNDPNTDYINASFIKGYTGEDEYIACQGPKEETTYDFWRMVDQYNINIIVMLTQLVEKGKEKCHQYYPTIRETFRYENMTIRCTSELDYRTYTQRTLVLQKENKKRSIIQLHFKDWPDHDVPEDFDPMINFCQIMRRNISTSKGFVVVHCSAGIGRTGTLISIDILLQHLRDNKKLDVFGIVYRLRYHRINMVQRESQYAYIYNCIKQVLKNPYFLKTYKPPPVDPVYENISRNARDTANTDANLVNGLEMQ